MKREFDWSPSVSFEEGIRETVQWYLDHKEWWTRVMTGEYLEYYQRNYHDA
jgi:dTDP-glucose 4,6-dehydratase